MKASDLRQKNPSELGEELMENLKEQFVLRMQRSTGQLSRPSEMKKVRRNIARIKTVISEMKVSDAGK